MKKSISFRIIQSDIDKSDGPYPDSCPVACALKRSLKTDNVLVFDELAKVDGKNYDLPEKLQENIAAYYKTGKMKVGRFTLTQV